MPTEYRPWLRSSDARTQALVDASSPKILDYAANGVVSWSAEQLRERFQSRCRQDGRDPTEELRVAFGERTRTSSGHASTRISLPAACAWALWRTPSRQSCGGPSNSSTSKWPKPKCSPWRLLVRLGSSGRLVDVRPPTHGSDSKLLVCSAMPRPVGAIGLRGAVHAQEHQGESGGHRLEVRRCAGP